MILNKVLKWFGLMTIERARVINRELHVEYVRWITDAIEEDFDVKMKDRDALKDNAIDFADDSFDRAMAQDSTQIFFEIQK